MAHTYHVPSSLNFIFIYLEPTFLFFKVCPLEIQLLGVSFGSPCKRSNINFSFNNFEAEGFQAIGLTLWVTSQGNQLAWNKCSITWVFKRYLNIICFLPFLGVHNGSLVIFTIMFKASEVQHILMSVRQGNGFWIFEQR